MRWFHTNPEYLAGVRNALVRGAGIHLTQCVAHARVTPAKFLGFFFGADRYLVVGERRQGWVATRVLWAALEYPNLAAKLAPEREKANESCGSESAGKGGLG